ncbi:MAG: CinA family protein [Kiloniellaceae bacterium]
MFPEDLAGAAERLLEDYRRAGMTIATAESCTGGLVAACLTEIPGSSDVVERGFVTYSDAAKTELLGVPAPLIRTRGAVSAEVAEAMAAGALEQSSADAAVAVTGIAGPGGATPGKPVGLVFLGAARRGGAPSHERHVFPGGRSDVRLASVRAALVLLQRLP